jgi:uncharacterized membrane protein
VWAVVAIGVAIAVFGLLLVVSCWRTRTTLGGVLGAICLLLVGLALAARPNPGARDYELIGAGVALAIGTLLFVIGQVLQRLLDHDPPDCA